MRMLSTHWMVAYCCAAALLTAGSLTPSKPANAQISIGGFGISLGGFGGGGGRSHRSRTRSRHSSEDNSASESSEPTSRTERTERKDRVLASKGAPPAKDQATILRYVASSEVLGVVGSTKDLEQVGQAYSKEDDRDYTGRIKDIIEKFKTEQIAAEIHGRGTSLNRRSSNRLKRLLPPPNSIPSRRFSARTGQSSDCA